MAIGAASSTPKEHLLLSHVDYRRYPGCTAMLLTPEVAQTWLDSAGRRPPPSDESKIAAYAQVMLDGEWQPGTLLAFYPDGRLDGVHRLWAVVRSGVSIQVAVFTACTR